MDKHIIISIVLFAVVDITVLVTFFLPSWVISNVGGQIQIGLWRTCVVSRKKVSTCFHTSVPSEWKYAIRFIFAGCAFATLSVISFVISLKIRRIIIYGRWLGLLSLAFFCLASVAIPMGFNMEQIKGEHFQLPNSFYVYLLHICLYYIVLMNFLQGRLCLHPFQHVHMDCVCFLSLEFISLANPYS